jgi:hypothetical protein
MSYYDNDSPISFFDDDDDIEAAVGGSQLHADDDDALDALNGNFDGIMDEHDNIEDMMDADDDLEELGGVQDDDAAIAQEIVNQCSGTLDDGTPKAAVSIALDMVNPETYKKQSIASQAVYKPVVHINKRMEFIEIVLTFPTAIDTNLRVMHANLEKYGQKLNELDELSQMIPIMAITIVPITGLGCYYIVANNPVFWAVQSEKFGGPANQMKILIRCEDLNFFQTDEVDISEITAAVMREREAEAEYIEQVAQREDERRRRDAGFNVNGMYNGE